MSQTFLLYRFHHADGRAKDWAWRHEPVGTLTVRWGAEGRLTQHKTYPTVAASQLQRTLTTKSRKGYVLVGERQLDDQGRVLEPALDSTPGIPGVESDPAIDLSQLDTGIEGGWF